MSDLTYRTRSYATASRDCIRNPQMWSQYAISGTISLTATVLADSDSETLYAPDEFLPVGTLLAFATGGSYSGLWVPYLPNISAANGEDTARAILFEPVYFSRSQAGSIEQATVIASLLPEGTPAQVFLSKMPEYNDHTAYAGGSGSSAAAVAADLPTGFVDLDALGVDNIGGI